MADTTSVFKALADKTRLDIVRSLVNKPDDCASCNEVSSMSALSQPAMSHHFKKLVDAGVLTERKVGTEKVYELNRPVLDSMGLNPDKF
jgi:ArsR family transcriptional regulator, arsenate/arsenite/antimonite-responsive transcriptional repressor